MGVCFSLRVEAPTCQHVRLHGLSPSTLRRPHTRMLTIMVHPVLRSCCAQIRAEYLLTVTTKYSLQSGTAPLIDTGMLGNCTCGLFQWWSRTMCHTTLLQSSWVNRRVALLELKAFTTNLSCTPSVGSISNHQAVESGHSVGIAVMAFIC